MYHIWIYFRGRQQLWLIVSYSEHNCGCVQICGCGWWCLWLMVQMAEFPTEKKIAAVAEKIESGLQWTWLRLSTNLRLRLMVAVAECGLWFRWLCLQLKRKVPLLGWELLTVNTPAAVNKFVAAADSGCICNWKKICCCGWAWLAIGLATA